MPENEPGTVQAVDPMIWKSKPALNDGRGYLYVILFSTDVIKVGRTHDPAGRMDKHIKASLPFRSIPIKVWFSDAHVEYEASEALLIEHATRAKLGKRVRREYFHGTDFERAVELAEAAFSRRDPFSGDIDLARQRFDASMALAQITDDLLSAALGFRDEVIFRIWEAERIPLSQLADRAGISKARADQIVRKASGRPDYRQPGVQPSTSPAPGSGLGDIRRHLDGVTDLLAGMYDEEHLRAA